ncbi:unnamed protein product [Litomosoides sigmodontis]|uniref:Uncharacterized protein n=1 Tax=Litomosoides sigmodontis TaxID=42156 RepID=A0A3P6TEJ9_LITSI|nr:unnamed protein product [Litomosoides sigmodontis]
MYMQYAVKPEIEQKLGRPVKMVDVLQCGRSQWAELTFEEREGWKQRAKEYNACEVGRNERMLTRLAHQQKNRFDEPCTSLKWKLSKILPSSWRYDEIDQYSRKYFAAVDDDFERKRENDRKEFFDRYQWKFVQKDLESKKEFFRECEVVLVTASAYYEDSSNRRIMPSEISILKFSIGRGIYDHRHYILGFAENGILNENVKAEVEENERLTGLLMDCDKMPANVRFDYAQIWDEIMTFTKIDGDSVKLLLLSKDWNVVVGSFDALFVHANEKPFSRIETRFVTLEDYFMVIYATLYGACISNEIKSDISREMNESWHRAVFLNSMMCDFHAQLKNTEQCQARSCSLFAAYKAAFSFFALYKKHIFPAFELTKQNILNKKLLPATENRFLECTLRQPSELQSFIHKAGYSWIENIPMQSNSLFLPENGLLNSSTMEGGASECNIRNIRSTATELNRKIPDACSTQIIGEKLGNMSNQIGFHCNVERRSSAQRPPWNSNNWEMVFSMRNLHVSNTFTHDKRYSTIDAADNQLFSVYQFRSAASCRHHQEISLHQSEQSKSNLPEIDLTCNRKAVNCWSTTGDMEFSNVMISSGLSKISSDNEKSEMLTDLSRADNDSDMELFYNVSILPSLCEQGFFAQTPQQPAPRMNKDYQNGLVLKASNKAKETSTLSSKEVSSHNPNKGVQGLCHNQFVSTHNTYRASTKPGQVFFSKVNQDKITPSNEGSVEYSSNSSSYSQKTREPALLDDKFLPERTAGGFCIPNIYENDSCIRKSRAATLASCKTGSRQNPFEKSRIIASQAMMSSKQQTSNQSPARNEEKGRKAEASVESSFSSTEPLHINNSSGYKCSGQKVKTMKPFILEPLICKEAEMFGWSENMETIFDETFIPWLNSTYFEPEITGSDS